MFENTENHQQFTAHTTEPSRIESLWIDPDNDQSLHPADNHLSSEEFSISGGKWGGSGRSGTSGGTVTWSLPGAGLSDQSGGDFFSGRTVSFNSIVDFDFTDAIIRAFDAWSSVADIQFRQVSDGGGNIGVGRNADIRISAGFIDGDSGFNTLAKAYLPSGGGGSSSQDAASGDIVMDSGQNWSPKLFFLTMLHEIGHALGLDHSNVNSIMSPTINTALNGLQSDDIAGIRAIYGKDKNGDGPSSGNDNLKGTASADSINLLAGDDRYMAGQGADLINGGNGADQLFGQAGNDRIFGDAGNDRINGGEGRDRIFGDGGNDQLFGAGQNDIVFGGGGNDRLTGGNDNDRLLGGAGKDTLNGDNGRDVLFGQGGNDQLLGGEGNDQMTGGAGADAFIFDDGFGRDRITDFDAGQDVLNLRRLDGVDSSDDLRFTQNGGDLILQTDGDSIRLEGLNLSDVDDLNILY